jgi:DNA/RNA-binding domain of Phe-tRNA-synthetase-like protein
LGGDFLTFEGDKISELRQRFRLETLKDEPVIKAYRQFYWSLGIDPTKLRPSSEALVRRCLQGTVIPRINNVVDANNLASI